MKNRNLMSFGESLVEFGKKKGADEVEIVIGDSSEFSVEIRNGQIERLIEAGSRGISVRLFIGQKSATASSSDLSKDTLHALIENAVARARLSHADPFAGLPEKEDPIQDVKSLQLFDPGIQEMTAEEKICYARNTETICLADERIKHSHGAGFETVVGSLFIVNSNGFAHSYTQTSCSCGVYLQAGKGDDVFEEGWHDAARNRNNLMTPEQIAQKAVHRATRLIGARKIATQNAPVVFEPKMTAGILNFLYACINGHNVYMKQTFLSELLGEKIAAESVTVIDDGLMPGAPGTKPFDSEGVPTRKTTVLKRGVLNHFLLDTYAARKLGMQSTGNASGANNLYIEAGTVKPEQMIRTVDNGLLLTGTIGQGLIPTTGDMSRGAFGMWIENGEIAYPVAEITIAGNLRRMLQNIELIGDDLEFRRSVTGPSVKIAEMTIAGT